MTYQFASPDKVPAFCPKCGRPTVVRSWETIGGETRYVYAACDGGWPYWLRRIVEITQVGHWTMTVAKEPVPSKYDPNTGELR